MGAGWVRGVPRCGLGAGRAAHPVQKRATMLAATARMLPVPISLLVRLREVSFFMYTISGAAAMRHVITGGYAQAHAPFGYKQA